MRSVLLLAEADSVVLHTLTRTACWPGLSSGSKSQPYDGYGLGRDRQTAAITSRPRSSLWFADSADRAAEVVDVTSDSKERPPGAFGRWADQAPLILDLSYT